jgi:8-oxo-dGTP pyrophosphatase MutT (NUDIX family)
MSDLRWRRLAELPGHDYRIFRTHQLDAAHPATGTVHRFSLLTCGDWVNVVALTPDDRVVLLRQWRPGTDTVGYEVPGGLVDPGEAPEVAAARELEEETGYVATRWRLLGKVAPNPALQGNWLHTYLALDAIPTGLRHPDDGEVLEVLTATLPDVAEMLRDGRIEHALVAVAFGHLALAAAGGLQRPANL